MSIPARLPLLFLGAATLLCAGCSFVRETKHGLRAIFQDEADYDEIEQDRAASPPLSGPSLAGLPATWTDFRGPGRRGEYSETPIEKDWPKAGLPVLWRKPVGSSYGSVVIAEGLVFSLEQRRDEEALVAYDLATGQEMWTHRWAARFSDVLSGEGPRSTPVYSRGLVLALGALGELRCVRASDGELRWRCNVLEVGNAENLGYGLSATPLIHGDLVICPTGKPKTTFGGVLAFHLETGEQLWSNLADEATYSSPVLASISGQPQIILKRSTRVVGLDPSNGELLWEFPWKVTLGNHCSQPLVVGDDRVVVSTGYGKGSAMIQLRESGRDWQVSTVWESRRFKNRYNPFFLRGEYLYGLDEGVLACHEVASGRRVWRDGRYGYGQLLWADDHFLVLDDEGGLHLIQADETGKTEISSFPALSGFNLNIPAAAHGRLLVKNKQELACFRLAPLPGNEIGDARHGM